jgi:alanine-glyoxylate transaminase/(R)-3-amino-2-methylpropionate-pyruvate transaminase
MSASSIAVTDEQLSERLLAGQRAHLFPAEFRYYDEPLVPVRARGVRVEAADGREYLDLFAGILTTSVGHCHPEVVERVQRQVATLGHTSTLYLTENEIEFAQRLAVILPGRLSHSFFTNSGTEAIETAVMLACMYTGRSDIIALRNSYSGRSVLASNLTASAGWRPLASSVSGIHHVLAPYPYRCPFHRPCDERCVDALVRELEETIVTTGGRPAAVLAETIQGVGGYIVPQRGYFQRVAEVIRRHGGLLIIDEVQAGFGRTGRHWFGIEHWGVEPDIVVMAKGIANGFPLGATSTRSEIAAAWTAKTISTFGGNPVTMAAAIATHEVMVREDVPARAAERGRQLRDGLVALRERHPWIGEVRGMGLMQGIEIVRDPASREPDAARARRLLQATRDEGVLIGLGGAYGSAIRLGPSLLITEDEVAEGIERIGRACRRLEAGA